MGFSFDGSKNGIGGRHAAIYTNPNLPNPGEAIAKSSEKILRKCVHCGMCNATCPTYGINGDELEGPRGRIYLIKDMLENNKPANKKIAKHIDSCLSCYSCMTTCPSNVNYMHLIDHGRNHIEKTYKREIKDFLN